MKKVKQRSNLPDLSPNQLEIMQVIWKQKETTVSGVWDCLRENRSVARNTILTLMDRLVQKGWLKRQQKSGTYYYSAVASQKRTLGDMVNRLVDKAFAGSSEELVLTLLERRGLTSEESQRIQSMIEDAQGKGGKS